MTNSLELSPSAMTVNQIIEWLRGPEAEQVRMDAELREVPPESALAYAIEARAWGPRGS